MKKNMKNKPEPTMKLEVTLKVTNAQTGESTSQTFNPDRYAFVMHSDAENGDTHMSASLLGGVSQPSDMCEIIEALERIRDTIFKKHPEVKTAYGAHKLLKMFEDVLGGDDDDECCDCHDCNDCADRESCKPTDPTAPNLHDASVDMSSRISDMFKGMKK